MDDMLLFDFPQDNNNHDLAQINQIEEDNPNNDDYGYIVNNKKVNLLIMMK